MATDRVMLLAEADAAMGSLWEASIEAMRQAAESFGCRVYVATPADVTAAFIAQCEADGRKTALYKLREALQYYLGYRPAVPEDGPPLPREGDAVVVETCKALSLSALLESEG